MDSLVAFTDANVNYAQIQVTSAQDTLVDANSAAVTRDFDRRWRAWCFGKRLGRSSG